MSSTGQTVGIVAGAVVGYFTGGVGAETTAAAVMAVFEGAAIGSSVGLALDPPKMPKLQGARLSDLTVQTATYGAVIPLVYGVNVVTGNVIWLENDRLAEVSSTTYSGGKGGPGQGTTNFSYQATFAVGLGKGPISSIRRVWVGSDLVYDVSPTASQATIDASLKLINGWTETVIDREEDVSDNQGTTYIDTPRDVTHPARAAFYTGSDSQNPDPRMQATLGVDNCPAYRGLCYMVFYDLDLSSYGNSLLGAQVKVELVSQRVIEMSTRWSATGATLYSTRTSAINPYNQDSQSVHIPNVWVDLSATVGEIVDADAGNLSAEVLKAMPAPTEYPLNLPLGWTPHGLGNTGSEFKGNADSYLDEFISTQEQEWNNLITIQEANRAALLAVPPKVNAPVVLPPYYPSDAHAQAAIDALIAANGGTNVVSDVLIGSFISGVRSPAQITYSGVGTNDAQVTCATDFTGGYDVRKITTRTYSIGTVNGVRAWRTLSNLGNFEFTPVWKQPPSANFITDGNGRWLLPSPGFPWVQGGSAMLDATGYGGTAETAIATIPTIAQIASMMGGITTTPGSNPPSPDIYASDWHDGGAGTLACYYRWNLTGIYLMTQLNAAGYGGIQSAVHLMSQVSYVDTVTLSVVANPDLTLHSEAAAYQSIEPFDLLQSGAVTTGGIIADLCERTGIIYAADIDRAALTSSVTGYRVTNIAAARAGIEQIQTAYPFDVIQDGYKIKFQPRGGSPVATIGWENLDARGATQPEGVQLTVSREMDSILPRKVTVGYLDVDREQDASEQYAERLNVSTVNATSVDIPIAMTATQAAGIAEVLLYLYWMERYEASFKLPASYNHLQPGDVVTVNTQTNSYEFRLVAVNYTSDGRVECAARYNSASVYVPVAVGYSGASVGGSIDIPSQTFTEYLDIPLIVEANNVPGFVVAMRGGEASWRAGSLFVTDDNGGTWADVKDLSSPAFIGTAQSMLSARSVNDCGLIDKSSVLTVTPYPHVAALSSVTELQMFNGANLFAYGADGRWEIIAAQNCVLQIDGSYIITDLLRGRFGSEWATGLHAAGDHVVSLAVGTSGFVTIESGKIGINRIYRSVTSGRSLSTAGDYAFRCNAMNLEPLSPVYAKAYRAASQDWVMEWVRRTRIGGELRDLVDAQLGEVAESYDVLIYDATYTTLKRTITVTSPACTYTSAEQITDFGGTQGVIYARIYQNSAMVGRGRELQVTFTG